MNSDNDELLLNDIKEEQDVLNSIAEDDLKLTPPMTGWIANTRFLQMYCSPPCLDVDSYNEFMEKLGLKKDDSTK